MRLKFEGGGPRGSLAQCRRKPLASVAKPSANTVRKEAQTDPGGLKAALPTARAGCSRMRCCALDPVALALHRIANMDSIIDCGGPLGLQTLVTRVAYASTMGSLKEVCWCRRLSPHEGP